MSDYRRGHYDGQQWASMLNSAGEAGRSAGQSLFGSRSSSPCDACNLRVALASERVAKDLARSIQMGLIAGIRAVSHSLPPEQRPVISRSIMMAFEPAFRRSAATHGVDSAQVEARIAEIMEIIASMIVE